MALWKSLVSRCAVGLTAAGAFAGCTSGNSAIEPPFQSVNISTLGKLQFVVGTANIATIGAPFIGLNTVVTFRQASGGSAFAVNTPQIVGPAAFKVPAVASAGTDAGTNTIDSTPQGGTTTPTFSSSNQATLYGFGPNNYDTSGAAHFGDYALPIYYDELANGGTPFPQFTFYGVPPAFQANTTGGFLGYNPGFVYFAAQAVSGAYALNVTIPTSAGSSQAAYTYHAAATLNAAKVLPALTAPAFADDGAGGGTLTVGAFPAGVTSELIEITDEDSGGTATFNPAGAGPQTVPDGTLTSGDSYSIAAVGFDYSWFADAAPLNGQQAPPLPAQADLTVAYPTAGTAAGTSAHARRAGVAALSRRPIRR
jgi:hypothetical protein